jgi:hypothetical protein
MLIDGNPEGPNKCWRCYAPRSWQRPPPHLPTSNTISLLASSSSGNPNLALGPNIHWSCAPIHPWVRSDTILTNHSHVTRRSLSSTKIVHTLFSTQPYKNTRPFYALPQEESNAVALAVKKIIGETATRFNDMYPLYVLATSSHSNNSSSIATVERHTAPPRKHATRKRAT